VLIHVSKAGQSVEKRGVAIDDGAGAMLHA
jgi:hypothetical protein